MKRRLTAGLVAAGLAGAGCAGPQPRIDYGGKAVPINVAFGKPKAVNGPPPVLRPGPGGIGVVPLVPGLSGFAPPPPSAGATTPAPTVPPVPLTPCPAQDPLASPRREATPLVQDAVPQGTFPYRLTGSFTVNGARTRYAATVVTTVKQIASDPANRRRFTLSFRLLGVPYTVTYAVQAPVEGPAAAITAPVPGEIGLAGVVRDSEDGLGASFLPSEPVRLLQLRAAKGDTWTDAGTDPRSQSTATVAGQTVDKVRVNACGQPVEAWKAVVTQHTVTPDEDVTATRTLYFATGYGGLLVGEQVSFSGKAGNDRVSGDSTSTIDVDPGAP